jgi:hypothetical protein
MGTSHAVVVGLLIGILGQTGLAAAQGNRETLQLPRGDVSLQVGITGTNEPSVDPNDNWYGSWNGAVSVGYYWTEHLKTELDAGLTSEGQQWGRRVLAGDIYAYSTHSFSTRSMTLSQQYQFGHNARFHPFVGAGIALEWIRHTEERQPVYQILRVPPYQVLVQPARTIGPTTDVQVVPVVSGGFKGYLNERGFFRSDFQIGFRGGVRHLTVRSGFGFDF